MNHKIEASGEYSVHPSLGQKAEAPIPASEHPPKFFIEAMNASAERALRRQLHRRLGTDLKGLLQRNATDLEFEVATQTPEEAKMGALGSK